MHRRNRSALNAGVLLLLLAANARADVVLLNGFESVNTESTTAIDGYLMTEGCSGGGSVDADMRLTTDRDHNAANGGHASGSWAAFVDVASGESRCYATPATSPGTATALLAADELAVSINLHLPSIPATAWTPLALMSGANRQCAVQITTSGTLLLYHGTTATTFGTSATILRANACSNDAYRACTSSSDCVGSAACATCTSGTSAGCFMPTIEVHQRNVFQSGGNQVVCDLWVSGRHEVTGTAQASGSTIGTVDAVHLGAPSTEAVARSAYFDDLVIATGDRAGHGWIATGHPSSDGGVKQWVGDSCPDATHWNCIDDWLSGAQYNSSANGDTIRQANADRTDEIARFTSMVPADDATVTAVGRLLVGRTSADAGTWTYEHATLVCETTTSCVATTAVGGSTTQLGSGGTALGFAVNAVAPPSTVWSPTVLGKAGLRVRLITRPANSNFRLGAALLYARGQLPDEPLPSNLKDHNLGTDDGIVTVCGAGDSLAGGTLAAVCQEPASNAGTACSQDSYCSWDAPNGVTAFGDLPSGGCSSDAQCQTCTGRRNEVNAGAGYQCTADAECGNVGTCSSGVCSQNDRITCSVDADCRSLGTCDTTATCTDACPGGDCPDRVFWPYFLGASVNSDYAVASGQGNETSWQFRDNRLEDVLLGRSAAGVSSRGDGVCGCSVNADCGTAGTPTCTAGRCVAGDANRLACRLGGDFTGGDCASGFACLFPPCDYLVVMESPNDTAGSTAVGQFGANAPTCAEAPSVYVQIPGGPCDGCGASLACVSDATCTAARGPDSRCVGTQFQGTAYPCVTTTGGQTCTATTSDCKATSECPAGQTCSVNDPSEHVRSGFCECQEEADCAGTHNCVGGICRLIGGNDNACSEPDRAGAYNSGAGVCWGQCTCPCSHATCTTSADCPVTAYATASTPAPRTYRGDCVGGLCTNCGPTVCEKDPAIAGAFRRFTKPLLTHGMSHQFQRMQDFVDRYSDGDGKPVLVFVTQPEYPRLPLTIYGGVRQLGNACDFALPVWQDWGYSAYHSRRTLEKFRHVADVRTLMRDRCRNLLPGEPCGYHVDAVHTLEAGARRIGRDGAGAYIAALNTCVVGAWPFYTAQRYCRAGDGTFQSATCASPADCSAGQSCDIRTCLTASSTTDDTSSGCPGSPVCNLE